MRDPILTIFNTCDDPRTLCKSIRRTLHLSQRKMAKRLLTTQSYICVFELGTPHRQMRDTEFKRILYNLKLDFQEAIEDIALRYGREPALLTFQHVLIEYLSLTTGRNYNDRPEVIKLLSKFQDEFKQL